MSTDKHAAFVIEQQNKIDQIIEKLADHRNLDYATCHELTANLADLFQLIHRVSKKKTSGTKR